MSYIDLMKVIKSIGYKAFKCLWYRHPLKALCRGSKQLNCDSDILQLAKDVSRLMWLKCMWKRGCLTNLKKS